MADEVVVDASAFVDLLLGNEVGDAVGRRLRGCSLHAPAHLDAEALSALGRLERAGQVRASDVATRLELLASAPVQRHPLPPLLDGAWRRRHNSHNIRLVDAVSVELAHQLGFRLLTTDGRLAEASNVAELPPG